MTKSTAKPTMKLSETKAKILDFLYTPGTKRPDAATLIVFEGLHDDHEIADRAGITVKTAGNVRRTVQKTAEAMLQAR